MSEDNVPEGNEQNKTEEELAGCFGFGCLIYIVMFLIMFCGVMYLVFK